ncbi:MAG: hypothetical protein NVSMB56_07510 [Pyrinomonadaceae bacterium]
MARATLKDENFGRRPDLDDRTPCVPRSDVCPSRRDFGIFNRHFQRESQRPKHTSRRKEPESEINPKQFYQARRNG